jgi:hypothetical protein
VDPSTATGCRGFFSDRPDELRIASHEDDLGSSPSELDRGGSSNAASSSREHDDSHATDLTCARSPRPYIVGLHGTSRRRDATVGAPRELMQEQVFGPTWSRLSVLATSGYVAASRPRRPAGVLLAARCGNPSAELSRLPSASRRSGPAGLTQRSLRPEAWKPPACHQCAATRFGASRSGAVHALAARIADANLVGASSGTLWWALGSTVRVLCGISW